MVTCSSPIPMPAMKRQISMLAAVFWNAMIAVQIEYQTSEKMKIERRPNRSAMEPKHMHPANIPAKLQNTKKPTPLMPNNPAVLLTNNPLATRPGVM